MAGGLHGGCDGGLSDHRAVLQRDSGLGRDEHQRGLVPARARLCHVSFRQWLLTHAGQRPSLWRPGVSVEARLHRHLLHSENNFPPTQYVVEHMQFLYIGLSLVRGWGKGDLPILNLIPLGSMCPKPQNKLLKACWSSFSWELFYLHLSAAQRRHE